MLFLQLYVSSNLLISNQQTMKEFIKIKYSTCIQNMNKLNHHTIKLNLKILCEFYFITTESNHIKSFD